MSDKKADAISKAADFGIELKPEDVVMDEGEATVDGLEASEWLYAMTQD